MQGRILCAKLNGVSLVPARTRRPFETDGLAATLLGVAPENMAYFARSVSFWTRQFSNSATYSVFSDGHAIS